MLNSIVPLCVNFFNFNTECLNSNLCSISTLYKHCISILLSASVCNMHTKFVLVLLLWFNILTSASPLVFRAIHIVFVPLLYHFTFVNLKRIMCSRCCCCCCVADNTKFYHLVEIFMPVCLVLTLKLM